MGTHMLEIEYPDDVLDVMSEAQVRTLAREALYTRLYARGVISSGRAAELLGISRWDFLDLLGSYGVSYFDEQIDNESAGQPSRHRLRQGSTDPRSIR